MSPHARPHNRQTVSFRNWTPKVSWSRQRRDVDFTKRLPCGGDARRRRRADTPPGDYFVCAGVDQDRRVPESNERNNAACNPIRIGASLRIDPRRAPQLTPRLPNSGQQN
jgi:hypothetical protein